MIFIGIFLLGIVFFIALLITIGFIQLKKQANKEGRSFMEQAEWQREYDRAHRTQRPFTF